MMQFLCGLAVGALVGLALIIVPAVLWTSAEERKKNKK